MKIFKLMYLKKKGKLDERGAALANVLLISTFVMVLTSSILSMAYSSYQMKQINLNSKNNFYSCEAVLDQIKVGFRNEMDALMKKQVTGTTASEEDVQAVCKAFYKEYRMNTDTAGDKNAGVSTDQALNSKGIYYYDLSKVAALLTSIAGVKPSSQGTTVTQTSEKGLPVHSATAKLTAQMTDSTDIQVTLKSDVTGTNNFELTDTYVVFHDLTVIYSEYGYESRITTDIKITFPSSGSTGNSGDGNGWVTLSTEMIRERQEWNQLFADPSNAEHDYGNIVDGDSTQLIVNTTDYSADTVQAIQFEMPLYSVSAYDVYGWDGYYEQNRSYKSYAYNYAYLKVQVQDGPGRGNQYAACDCQSGNYSNVYIYIGDGTNEEDMNVQYDDEDEMKAHNWVKAEEIFENYSKETYEWKESGYYKYYAPVYKNTDAAKKFVEKYFRDGTDNPDIQYLVKLENNSKDGRGNSRGWIVILGGGKLSPKKNNLKLYVDNGESKQPTLLKDYTKQYGSSVYAYYDFSKCGYSVGDTLRLVIKNVDISKDNGLGYGIVSASNLWIKIKTTDAASVTYNFDLRKGWTVEKLSDTSVQIDIPITWDVYPYLEVFYKGAQGDATLSMEMTIIPKDSSDNDNTSGSKVISSDALITYQNWRKE